MNQASKIVVIGSGGHAAVVASTLITSGYKVVAFYDDDSQKWGSSILGIPITGPVHKVLSANDFSHGIVAIGQNEQRKKLVQKLDLNWISVIHPFSWVHPEVEIGVGTIVCAGAIVQPGATIGSHVIINTKASVDHHCTVGDFSHIATSHLAGGASIEEGVFMALSSTVLPGINVEAWATIGAGAVVNKDIPSGVTVVGSPARKVKTKMVETNPNKQNSHYSGSLNN